MRSIINALVDHTPIGRLPAELIVVIALFAIAGVVSKLATRFATYLVDRSERRRRGGTDEDFDTGVITGIRQRETAISLIETSVRYLVVRARAAVLDRGALGRAAAADDRRRVVRRDRHRLRRAAVPDRRDRRPADVLRGLVPDRRHGRRRRPEGAGRRRVRLAALAAPAQHHRRDPVRPELAGERAARDPARLPRGRARVLHERARGRAASSSSRSRRSFRSGRRASSAARRWPRPRRSTTTSTGSPPGAPSPSGASGSSHEFLPSLLRERAAEGLLVHGPIITYVDEQASHSFARAMGRGDGPLTGSSATASARCGRSGRRRVTRRRRRRSGRR